MNNSTTQIQRLFAEFKKKHLTDNYSDDFQCEEILGGLSNLESDIQHLIRSEVELESDLLSNLTMMLAQAVNMDAVLNTIMDGLQQLVPYDAGGIFLIGEDPKVIESQVLRGYRLEKLPRVRLKVDEGIIGASIAEAEINSVADVSKAPKYISARNATNSEIAIPIISNEEVIGCINLESDYFGAFSSANIRLLKDMASHAAFAVERARSHATLVRSRQVERELQIARRIQIALLPRKAPLIDGYDIAGLNVPSREIGGDYYDFIPITDNDLGLVIADVSGKGVPAGLIMSGLRAALRARVETTFKIQRIIHSVNCFLCDSLGSEDFVTAFYAVLNAEKGQLSYVNAGHDWPILLHSDDSLIHLDVGGPLLGVIPGTKYNMATIKLEPGSVLVLYTDGIVEAGGAVGKEMGTKRLEALIKELKGESSSVIARNIEREAALWNINRGEADDRTVIVVKRL